MNWERFYAVDLLEALESSGSLGGLVPEYAGIYLWKLRLRPSCHPQDSVALGRHLDRIVRLPMGRISEINVSRGIRVGNLTFGGSGMPTEKVNQLKQLIATKQGANFIVQYLDELEPRTPALYCGEAGNVALRLADHLKGNTDFAQAIASDPDLVWSDLFVEITRTGSKSSEDGSANRRAIEYFTTVMTSSMYTKRAG